MQLYKLSSLVEIGAFCTQFPQSKDLSTSSPAGGVFNSDPGPFFSPTFVLYNCLPDCKYKHSVFLYHSNTGIGLVAVNLCVFVRFTCTDEL